MKVIQELIDKYESIKTKLSFSPERAIEKGSCDVYLAVFRKCLRKSRANKLQEYIKTEFAMCDKKRLTFKYDDQIEDAFQEALKQEAYRQVWVGCNLPGKLVKAKHLPMSYVGSLDDLPRSAFHYMGAKTGRMPMSKV